MTAFLASVCGGHLMSASFSTKIDDALQRPLSSALLGLTTWALPSGLLYLAVLSLYFFPPLAIVLYLGTPIAFWLGLAVGFAAFSERVGLWLKRTDVLEARVARRACS